MRNPGLSKWFAVILVFCAATVIASPAQTFTTLASFVGTDGTFPYYMSLVQATDGNFYGTTLSGGTFGGGTVFRVTPAGTVTLLYSFCTLANCADGNAPFAGLVQATDGSLYGTTYAGGANGRGTVFEITLAGALTTLYSFCALANCSDGINPYAPLVQAANGNFYGTTEGGGANGSGTVFEITPAGKLTTLYSFCALANCADGINPFAGLIQATNGDFYGTAYLGGSFGEGTVFSITSAGVLTTLYNFCSLVNCVDGLQPTAGLLQASNGDFYGTASGGAGTSTCGTIFKMTSAGVLTTLRAFDCANGVDIFAGLIQGTDGNLYGTTYGGGTKVGGTAFKVTTAGKLTTLYNFCEQANCTDGANPFGALLQSTNGTFYGATSDGGADGLGAVFSVATGLGPFVEMLPTSGKVASTVIILGNGLTGTTSVTFNGTTAAFAVVSSTEISTTVPTGATTGTVAVTTPSGTLKSNVTFRVTK